MYRRLIDDRARTFRKVGSSRQASPEAHCYGASANDPFAKNFTAAQAVTAKQLIAEIKGRTAIGSISGHNDYEAKACPGFNVRTSALG